MNTDYIILYCPHYIELLYDFFGALGMKMDQRYTTEERTQVFIALEELLNNKIIFACDITNGIEIERWNLSVKKTINKIDKLWREDLEFPEFYNLVWFGYEPWYTNKLIKIGYSGKVKWEFFVKNNIGNLEKWIEENKPRE